MQNDRLNDMRSDTRMLNDMQSGMLSAHMLNGMQSGMLNDMHRS